jgi:predicted DNA-binding ribbon-helix-helix protein
MHRGRSPTDARSTLVLRNVVVAGTRTSMRLERWDALHEIAADEKTNVNEIVTRITRAAGHASRTSAVRVFIMTFYKNRLKRAAPWLFRPTLWFTSRMRELAFVQTARLRSCEAATAPTRSVRISRAHVPGEAALTSQ